MRKRFLLMILLFLTACAQAAPAADAPNGNAPLRADPAVTPVQPAATFPFLPSDTPLPAPDGDAVLPSATPTPAPAATKTPVPNPMDIRVMRQRDYPGSDITIEQELDPGANYRRYYASYLSDGLKIYALLTIPNGAPPEGGWPAIVFNHGYIPPPLYHTTERYVAYVDRLARAGYIVFRIDYRGHDRSEGVAAGAYGDPGYTIDVLNAVGSLKRFPAANPNEIGMWGHSMGGFLTLRAMVISKDIKAGVIWSGVVASYPDLMCCWRRTVIEPTQPPTTRRWRSDWIRQYGTPEENPAFWSDISATSYLGDLSGPLQLHHSLTDPEVPVEFSQKLQAAAPDRIELYTYENDDHNLSKSFSTAMQKTIEFFDQYLKGVPRK